MLHFHYIRIRKINLVNSWNKLLRDVRSNCLVVKFHLGVIFWLKRLKDSHHFTVLPRAACLLLVSKVKPAENIIQL